MQLFDAFFVVATKLFSSYILASFVLSNAGFIHETSRHKKLNVIAISLLLLLK